MFDPKDVSLRKCTAHTPTKVFSDTKIQYSKYKYKYTKTRQEKLMYQQISVQPSSGKWNSGQQMVPLARIVFFLFVLYIGSHSCNNPRKPSFPRTTFVRWLLLVLIKLIFDCAHIVPSMN